MKKMLALTAIGLVVLAGCGSEPAEQESRPAPSSSVSSPNSSQSLPATGSPAPAPTATDPFAAYQAEFAERGLPIPAAAERERFEGGTRMFCAGGRDQLVQIKQLASDPPGVKSREQAVQANAKAATGAGAMWEHGCGKGEDPDLYAPQLPCEPGYPNCSKVDSDRYLANLDYLSGGN